jgi:hypothetical protein
MGINSIKHLNSLVAEALNTYELGCYDKEVFIREGDTIYPINTSANYERIQFKKTISTHGRNIPPHPRQVVYITRTGQSPVNVRDGKPLIFERYTDETNTYYVMPQDMIQDPIITESYADFFRESETGGDPYNETDRRAYWWFMVYDIYDPENERFCFLPRWAEARWPTLTSLFQQYYEKFRELNAVPELKNFDVQIPEINLKMSFRPEIMAPFELNMRLPSTLELSPIADNSILPDVIILNQRKQSPNAGSVKDDSGYADKVDTKLFYWLYKSPDKRTRDPHDDKEDGNYNGVNDRIGANFYFFGDTEHFYFICEELKLTYLVTIYGLPSTLEKYGYHEYIFLFERFNDMLIPGPDEPILEIV